MQKDVLAWYMYPEPSGSTYYKIDLKYPETVIEIFDYCQILLAYITKDGWKFLAEYYGFDRLFELNKSSDWLDCNTVDEWSYIESEINK